MGKASFTPLRVGLAGYFRVWDLAQVILAGRRYRIEDVGVLSEGGALFAVFVCLANGVA
jgi:hypothetical protein